MTDKRFIIDDAGELIDLNNHQFIDYGDEVCKLLNELADENEQLKNRLKDWHQKTFKAHEYFNIIEKVIDEVCDNDISNQIWKEYEKREKLIE